MSREFGGACELSRSARERAVLVALERNGPGSEDASALAGGVRDYSQRSILVKRNASAVAGVATGATPDQMDRIGGRCERSGVEVGGRGSGRVSHGMADRTPGPPGAGGGWAVVSVITP